MSDNNVILLDKILEQRRSEIANSLSESDYFEVFSFEQILKNYDLSYDELLAGCIGGGDDGGIDGFFTFINEDILTEDTDTQNFKRNSDVDIYLIQAKRSASFSESAFNNLIPTVKNIFDLSKEISSFQKVYNEELVAKVQVFREAYENLAVRHAKIKIHFVYSTKGNTATVNPKVRHKASTLEETISSYFPGAVVNVKFIGARELLEASRIEKSYTLKLAFLENYISRGEDNYIVLASLKDYYSFVTDENENLRRYVFESNVRDYQGDVEVNDDIKATLEKDDPAKDFTDFWWLNNGITVLSSRATVAGKTINLDDVQIVNGLQTTTTIYNYFRSNSGKARNDSRAILIKVIVVDDLNTAKADRIIKATNFQTRVLPASLRATEPIHRDIEDYFKRHDWFYDRRKNYYKNLGKAAEKIISIEYLAQAVTALVYSEPHISRGRPTAIIRRDSDYNRVFNKAFQLELYLFCAKTMKCLDTFVRNITSGSRKEQKQPYQNASLRNLSFHFGTLIIIKSLNKTDYSARDLQALTEIDMSSESLKATWLELFELVNVYTDSSLASVNTIAKQKEFVTYIIGNITLS